jgi:hypothetical protein
MHDIIAINEGINTRNTLVCILRRDLWERRSNHGYPATLLTNKRNVQCSAACRLPYPVSLFLRHAPPPDTQPSSNISGPILGDEDGYSSSAPPLLPSPSICGELVVVTWFDSRTGKLGRGRRST